MSGQLIRFLGKGTLEKLKVANENWTTREMSKERNLLDLYTYILS